MGEEQAEALQSLRERIRAVCIHDQAQWDASWKMALSDPSANGRGLLPSDVFFKVLEANSVALGRSAVRVLLRQFQEPSGAIQAAKFLRWMALSAPVDHVDPELLFARLPQPYRRIQKVLDCDIIDAAWSIISTQSSKFKAENLASSAGAAGTETLHQQQDDYEVAKTRFCQPTQQFALSSESQRVAGLVAHTLAPIVVVALHHEAPTDPAPDPEIAKPSLRVVSTAKELEVLGDFPIEFFVATETSNPLGDASPQSVHVRIKSLSELQRVGSDVVASEQSHFSYYLAVHLEQTTTVLESGDPEKSSPSAPTTREMVSVYSIETQKPQAASDGDASTSSQSPQASCRLIAALHPTPNQPVTSVLLSPDAELVATSTHSGSFAFYSLHRQNTSPDAASDAADHPLVLSSPVFRVDLEPNRSAYLTKEPLLHFLVAPATTQDDSTAALTTYAFVICHGVQVLKYLLPTARNTSSSSPPSQLTSVKTWEHLAAISSSTLDAATQFLALGLEDGSLVVWDVLRDVNHAFLAPLAATDGNKGGISSLGFCRDGYLVALSTTTQWLIFYDIRSRGRPALVRIVTPPFAHASSLAATSTVLMEEMVTAPETADVPVVLVEHSNGMVLLYDVRSGQAIGSFVSKAPQTPTLPSASSSSTSLTPESQLSRSARTIAVNQEALCVASSPSSALHMMGESVGLHMWRDVLLTCFPSFSSVLQQRQEEPTSANVKRVFLSSSNSSSHLTSAAAPSAPATATASFDPLETLLLRMAGALPPSPSQQQQKNKRSSSGAASPSDGSQSPVAQGSQLRVLSRGFLSSQLPREPMFSDRQLQPFVPDDRTFFAQYCREHLDPAAIADKEAKLHRKRRDLLKVLASGGAW